MKVAIIHFGKKGAGPAISFEMAKALKNLGNTVFYYASTNVENRSYVEDQKFEQRFFDTYTSKISYIKSVLFGNNIKKVISSIRVDNPDVIFSPMNDMWAPFLFPRLKGFLRIKTIHDVGVHEGNNSIVNKWWNNTNFKDAEKFVILSKKFVPELLKRGILLSNIDVIPHAGFDYYQRIATKINITQKNNILFFGRIDKYKGLNILLDAMPLITKEIPSVKLTIVGNGDLSPYSNQLSKVVNNVDVHNEWIKDEDVAGYISQAEILILPYTHATQSGVIPLAYAFSIPVIATDVGCLSEQVINKKTGYLIEKNNPEVLALSVIKMLNNRAEMKKMGQYAHQYMLDNLTWEASAKSLIKFVNSGNPPIL